jgi:hypothetical protein
MLVKTKRYSPPLSEKEIEDVKKARKSKGKTFKNVEDLIKDLNS